MKNKLTHFAIYANDMQRAQKFYDTVFGWSFMNYGQPDFVQIRSDQSQTGELIGALQARSYSPIPDNVIGFECTIAVENIDAIINSVTNSGGKVVMPKTEIPHVGWIAKFTDTEGNLFCAMQYSQHP